MSNARDARLRDQIAHAFANAPAVRAHFEAAGIAPADIQSEGDLEKIPVFSKDAAIALQQANPPFGGMLAVPLSAVRRIFFSPGPLYEPDAGSDQTPYEMGREAARWCGLTADDVVLNALSYHLVPAGLLVDEALTGMGCTVLPAGTGSADLMLKMMRDFGVTAYAGTPSFLMRLIQRAEEMGLDFQRDFQLRRALVTAEPLAPALRQTFVEKYGLAIGNVYATAELGLLAVNTGDGMAMRLLPEPIIQVVDPETGKSVGPGEAGEVVVTTYGDAYPLIRFGTGDLAVNVDPNPGASRQEERAIILVGRSGEAVKVRGMFVHPNQLRFAVGQLLPGAAVQGVVTRPAVRDVFTVRVAAPDPGGLAEKLQDVVRQVCRVRVDSVEFVGAEGLGDDERGMVDARDWR